MESVELVFHDCVNVSITNCLNDYINLTKWSNTKIVGINGTLEASLVGTITGVLRMTRAK